MVATPALLSRNNPPKMAWFDSYEEYHPHGTTAWQAPSLTTVRLKRYKNTGMERDEETGLQRHGRPIGRPRRPIALRRRR
ncbi:MAG: hypothetical protein EXR71_09855 [Myxococcales bacterium]|nr:hypothetical protein [Myxococcales bacterium]